MMHNICVAKQRQGAIYKISEHPISFAFAFLGFFTLSFVFLSWVGATPDPLPANPTNTQSNQVISTPQNPENPIRVVAKDIGLDVNVVNPASIEPADLDEALKLGAVRYARSAPLGVDGTVLLFGHSTSLPVVVNQYYKTFVNIQKLKTDAVISVYSGTTEYRYKVTGVTVADSTIDVVELPSDGKHLTLVTCNTFAAKEKRFIVTADFVGAYAL